jgi:hypothetical protein
MKTSGACGCGTILGAAETWVKVVGAWRGQVLAATRSVSGMCTRGRSLTLDGLASGWIPIAEGQCGRVASSPIRHQDALQQWAGPDNLFLFYSH